MIDSLHIRFITIVRHRSGRDDDRRPKPWCLGEPMLHLPRTDQALLPSMFWTSGFDPKDPYAAGLVSVLPDGAADLFAQPQKFG